MSAVSATSRPDRRSAAALHTQGLYALAVVLADMAGREPGADDAPSVTPDPTLSESSPP